MTQPNEPPLSPDAERVQREIEKVASVLGTARRLLSQDRDVELTALQGRVEDICAAVAGLPGTEARALAPAMENLIKDLDRVAAHLTERRDALTARLGDAGTASPPSSP